ncbi:hypothetical protein [Stygiolobus caldivivus]|uniref:Uncharacterized protein n=1 Tax=Stygiolobus caldivivus TaxID=2824673 RepID=A0A8D5ZJC0_9CREN|nr:hypothetical protein [Stygiolobus caldivivus]BCU70215.1 hypothetical protein KN1_15120 [Stygiolobus caldivivus]
MLSSVIQNIILLSLQKVSVSFCGVFSLNTWYRLTEGKTGNFIIIGRYEGDRAEVRWYDDEIKDKLSLKLSDGRIRAYYKSEEKVFNFVDIGYLYTWVSSTVYTSGNYEGLCQTGKRRGKIDVKTIRGKDVLPLLDREKLEFIFTEPFGRDTKLVKVVTSSDKKHVFFQFYRHGIFWYSELDKLMIKYHHLSSELIELKREIMSILNK